jgi:lipoxygenase
MSDESSFSYLMAGAADEPEAWRTDEEFAREMLAGLNPVVIKRLEVFPPVSRGGKESSITAAHIERQLQGRTVQKVSRRQKLRFRELCQLDQN